MTPDAQQSDAPRDVSQPLNAVKEGDRRISEDVIPLVYDELRRLAAYRLSHQPPGQTLQATALVHEAYLRLLHAGCDEWDDPHRFFCAAATAMRCILIDSARRKKSVKHGGHLRRVNLEDAAPAERLRSDELLALDQALGQLAAEDAEAARLVELRFFAGLSHQQTAKVMGITRRQADGLWAYARAWLHEVLRKDFGAIASTNSS